jgi:hypothetical protein
MTNNDCVNGGKCAACILGKYVLLLQLYAGAPKPADPIQGYAIGPAEADLGFILPPASNPTDGIQRIIFPKNEWGVR